MPEFTGHNDLRGYLRAVWRWKWLLLGFLVVVPAAAYVLESGKPKVYDASALVGINQATVGPSGGGSFSTSNVTAIAQLVTTSPVASAAADLMHPPASASEIASEVTATGDPSTNFLTIAVQDRSPARAAAIANAFAHAMAANLQASAQKQINDAIARITTQISVMPRKNPARAGLEAQLVQLQENKATEGSQAAILQPARPPSAPAGPHISRAVELGLIIGLLLGLGAVFLAESTDRRLHSPDELEAATKLPMLAAIAPTAFASHLDTDPQDEEAFHMLRTALMYFNVDQRLRSVLITSAVEQEGKTTISTRLAIAACRAGHDVVLVDADLRRAQVSNRLGISNVIGLGAVLARTESLGDAVRDYPINDVGAGRLRVLPAGPPPPNPAALISSGEMQNVLRQLETEAELLIVDTPAALAVSDSLALMSSVSGVVLVARMHHSTRQTIRRLQRMIESAHGQLLGVVATGVTKGPGYEHYYPQSYAQDGAPGHPRKGWRRLIPGRKGAGGGKPAPVPNLTPIRGDTSHEGSESRAGLR
jgi:capsular exopolysaccharide synthesis family protein